MKGVLPQINFLSNFEHQLLWNRLDISDKNNPEGELKHWEQEYQTLSVIVSVNAPKLSYLVPILQM